MSKVPEGLNYGRNRGGSIESAIGTALENRNSKN